MRKDPEPYEWEEVNALFLPDYYENKFFVAREAIRDRFKVEISGKVGTGTCRS